MKHKWKLTFFDGTKYVIWPTNISHALRTWGVLRSQIFSPISKIWPHFQTWNSSTSIRLDIYKKILRARSSQRAPGTHEVWGCSKNSENLEKLFFRELSEKFQGTFYMDDRVWKLALGVQDHFRSFLEVSWKFGHFFFFGHFREKWVVTPKFSGTSPDAKFIYLPVQSLFMRTVPQN